MADGASASEGRIVVAAPRALSNPSTGERDAGVEKGFKGDAKDGDRKRKVSGRKRHRKDGRGRKRSGSCSSDGSHPSSDDDEEHRRKQRKKHKSKKDRKRESKRDRKKRRSKHHRGSRSKSRSRSASRSRSRSHGRNRDDTSRSEGRENEEGSVGATAEIRLPKPSSGRSFASVSKRVAEVRPQSPKLLMIEDGKAEDDGTRIQQQQIEAKQDENIDFVWAYREASLRQCQSDAEKERQSLLLPIDYEALIEDESEVDKLYLDKQKRLNEIVRMNPTDTVAWIALANLNRPEPKARDSNAKETAGAKHESKDVARLERKREILTRGVQENLECFELRVALIETLERQCLLSAIPEKEVEAENDAAIRMFEILTAEENKGRHQDQQSRSMAMVEHSSNVHRIISLHRMRLRRYQKRKEYTATELRDSFIDAFASVSKACGSTGSATPAEMSVLFLDYLRAEALLGYSERAIALIQAALEINLYRNSENDGMGSTNTSWESSFFDYWNSESNRIGEVYPHTGWLQWDKTENLYHSEKAKLPTTSGRRSKKRLRASDFFAESGEPTSISNDAPVNQEANAEVAKDGAEASIDTAQSLASAYTSASSATQSNEAPLPINTQESAQVVGHILGAAKSAVEKEEERKRRREQEELEIFGENGKSVSSEAAVFAADGTDIAVSDVKHSKPTHAYVYSYILNRRIEVSLDELSGQATKDSLRSTLLHLRARKKKHETNKPSNVTNNSTDEKLYIIQEDDIFLRWAIEEAKTQDVIFLLPRKSLHDEKAKAEFYDPNERVWIEDGIQWIVTPYLSHFSDGHGIPFLVSTCLQFLGVSFPRSLMGDSFEMNRYVMGTSAGGGERLGQSILSETFDGVLKPSDGQRKLNPPPDPFLNIYCQLLLDDTTVIAFDERIFHPNNEKQRTFLRNCLYAIATSTSKQTEFAESEPSWCSYVQIALIAFEGRASGEKAAEVARSILEGTREAKCDPRLIIAYAMLDYNLRLSREPRNASKAFKSVSKILLRAMEAGGSGIFRSPYSSWWFELALMTVRSMMEMPIGAISEKPSNMITFPPAILSSEQRDRILHIICCAMEGSYQPLPPKEKSKKKKNEEAIRSTALVDEARMRKCMVIIRKEMADNKDDVETLSFSHQPSAEAFDRTPYMSYFAILSAWLAALDPKRCKGGGIDFNSGISLLDEFSSMKVPTREGDRSSFQTFLLRITHAKLELSILRCTEWGKSRVLPSPSFADCLVNSVAQLKSLKIAPSKSLMLAMAHMENQHSQRVKNGYSDLLVPGLDIGGIHPNEILFLLEKAVAAANKTINGPSHPRMTSIATCSCWTKDGRKMVEEAILTAIVRSTYCCYPSLYSALLQLSLLGSIQSKRPSRVFHRTKDLYHNTILPSCSFSKGLWLDAFTLLRPTYSEVEMVYHMAAMEEKDIRLRRGLEGVMRIAGAKTTGN